MESKNDDTILKEFSEPLLQKHKQQFIELPQEYTSSGLRSIASTYSILPISEVTHGAVEIWANLPDEIRQDPFFASFRQEHERIHGKKCMYFLVCELSNSEYF